MKILAHKGRVLNMSCAPSGYSRSNPLWSRFFVCVLMMLILWGSAPVFGAGKKVHLMLWTHQRHMADLTRQLIQEFNATVGRRKGIVVSVRILGDDASVIFQKAQRRREGPDLYSTNFDTGYADPVQAGARMVFDGFPGFKRWKAQWPEWYWMEGITTYQGHVYAIPVDLINSRLIYNRDLFRAIGRDPNLPPRSYKELREIAQAITRYTRGRAYGFAYCGGESWPVEWMPSQWAEANGDPAYWDWTAGRWALKGYTRVLQLLLDLKDDGSLFPGVDVLTNDALRAQFAEGRVGMFMGESWDVGVLNGQFRAKCDWAVAPIPTYDGRFHGKPRAMIIGGYWCINGKSYYPQQAWEVVQWFSRYEVRVKMVEAGKCIDPDPTIAMAVNGSAKVKGFSAFADTIDQDYIASYPYLPGWEMPKENPCTLFRTQLDRGGDLAEQLVTMENRWNAELDRYYQAHPSVKREWNQYPDFSRKTGRLGSPLIQLNFGSK